MPDLETRLAWRDHAAELRRRALRIADLYGNARRCFDRGEMEDGERLLLEAGTLAREDGQRSHEMSPQHLDTKES